MPIVTTNTYFSPQNGETKFIVTKVNDLYYVHCVGGVMSDGADHWTALHLSSALKMVEECIEDLVSEEE